MPGRSGAVAEHGGLAGSVPSVTVQHWVTCASPEQERCVCTLWYSICIYKYDFRNGDKGKVAQMRSQLR